MGPYLEKLLEAVIEAGEALAYVPMTIYAMARSRRHTRDAATGLSAADAAWLAHVRTAKPELYQSAVRVARAAGDESPRGIVVALKHMLS